MPSESCAIGSARDEVGVDPRLGVRLGDIAGEHKYLDLLGKWQLPVFAFLHVEVPEHKVAHRPDGGEPAGSETFAAGKFEKGRHDFIAVAEDEQAGCFVGAFVQSL